jgi:quinol monooxygenase YgiN
VIAVPVIVSTIKALDHIGDEVEQILAAAMPAIQRQPGCQLYALHRVRGRRHPGEFVLIEKWADDEALARYGSLPELIELHARLEPLIHSVTDYLVADASVHGDDRIGSL